MLQALKNYRSGGTGQLSQITFLILTTTCSIRVFTSYLETGDLTLVLIYAVAAASNGTILAQVNQSALSSQGALLL